MALSWEEKLVLKDLIKPDLETKKEILEKLYSKGSQKEIYEMLGEIASLYSILNKLNIKL